MPFGQNKRLFIYSMIYFIINFKKQQCTQKTHPMCNGFAIPHGFASLSIKDVDHWIGVNEKENALYIITSRPIYTSEICVWLL